MKKAIAIVAVVVIIAVAFFAFGGKNDNTSHSGSSSSSSSSQSVTTNQVTISNFAFSPSSITVKKDTKVTWTNQDSTSHTVTENDGKNGPSAAPMSQGQTYSFTFDQTGKFHYHCSIHPEMTGTVTVTD